MTSVLSAFLVISALGQTSPLTANSPIVVPGGAGGFDFMNVDVSNRLILAAHPKRSGFAVLDLKSGKVKEVDTVAVNGISADSKGKKVFAAGPGNTLVSFDSTTWNKVGSLALSGPGDCVQYNAKRGMLYVDNDDGTTLWVVNPKSLSIVKSVTIHEAPEYMEIYNGRNRIYQAIKSTDSVQVVDMDSLAVTDEWKLGTLKSPHGLAVDRKLGRVFVAGKNGKLVVLDAQSGKILSTLDVTPNSDQIAYDSGLKRLYIPGNEKLDVIQVSANSAKVIGSVKVPKGCHSVTVDPTTHTVWVAYSDATESYLMSFSSK